MQLTMMESKYFGQYIDCFLLTMSRTPLHLAIARSNDPSISRKLPQRGVDVCTQIIEGKTPLHTFFRETNRKLFTFARLEHLRRQWWITEAWICFTTFPGPANPLWQIYNLSWQIPQSTFWSKDHEERSSLFLTADRGKIAVLKNRLKLSGKFNLSDTDVNELSMMHINDASRRQMSACTDNRFNIP